MLAHFYFWRFKSLDKRKFLRSGAGLLTGVSLANVAQVGVTNAAYEGEKNEALNKAKEICDRITEYDLSELLQKDVNSLINKAYVALNEGNNSTGKNLNNILNDSNSLNQKKMLARAILNTFKDITFREDYEEYDNEYYANKDSEDDDVVSYEDRIAASDYDPYERYGGEKRVEEFRSAEEFVSLIKMLEKILDSDRPLDCCKSALAHENLLCKDEKQILDEDYYDPYTLDPDVIYTTAGIQLKHEDLLKHMIRFFQRMEEQHLSDEALRMPLEALLKYSVERSLYGNGVRYAKYDGISSEHYRINDFYKDKIKELGVAARAPKKLPPIPLSKVTHYSKAKIGETDGEKLKNEEKNLLFDFMSEAKGKATRSYEWY